MLRYAITDRSLFHGSLSAMLERLIALASDLDYIQVRERDLAPAQLEQFTLDLMAACALPHSPRILVNHCADVALACRAQGVHLRSSAGELTAAQVREIYSQAGFVAPTTSISCHTLEEVRRACDSAVDLVLFGPVFKKIVPGQPALPGSGLDLLHQACRIAAPTPVLALGGVTAANLPACMDAGAAGFAAIRHFLQQS